MTRFKMAFPVLLTLLLVVNLVTAADDIDDPAGLEVTVGPDIWFGKECTISDSKNMRNQVYMTSFWTGRLVGYKRFGKPEKKGKWFIHPVNTGGKTYFEFKNVDRKTYIAPFLSKGRVAGNYDQFSKTEKTNTLWSMDPPKQGIPVSIKHYKGLYMNQPDGSGNRVHLSSSKRTKWVINCK
jgi:hypothetical protein